jgi:hypothetical protein
MEAPIPISPDQVALIAIGSFVAGLAFAPVIRWVSSFAEFRVQQGVLPRGELRMEIQASSASLIAPTLAGLGWCVAPGQPLDASWGGYLASATINSPVKAAILDHLEMARPVQGLIARGACGVVTLSFGAPASPVLVQALP